MQLQIFLRDGEGPMREISYRIAINEALNEEMDRDPTVFLMGEDIQDPWMGTYNVTEGLSSKFGRERVRNTPISENAIVGASLGAALTGMRPVVELMYIDFSTLAMDQIVNQAAKIRYMSGGQVNVPLVIRTQGGAGRSLGAQHSQSLEAWFTHVPGLQVVMPSTPYDAKGLMKTAIRGNNPVIYIEHKMLYTTKGEVPQEEYLIPFGKADIKREGKDVTIVATSRMVLWALEAAKSLCESGIEAEVIDPRTLVPLDEEAILNSVKKTTRLVIAHEAVERNGWGAEVAALVADQAIGFLDAPIKRVASKNSPIGFAPLFEKYIIPGPEDIVRTVKEIV
jgi:pyruvate/2-oxoglutarate/acetoin dehydrogenase E1 component